MILFQATRRYLRAVLMGTFCLVMLQSSMLMAASSETSEDPMPPGVPAHSDSIRGAASSSTDAIVSVPRIPAIAVGRGDLYWRFMESRLEYRPTPGSDAGLITLPFRDILLPIAGTANPLSATFDLSRCGDAWKYISINIGYKKAKTPINEGKVEVWICPRFLAEREWATAGYLASVMDEWEAPVGYFWTLGERDVEPDNYDYLLRDIVMDDEKNIYQKWVKASIAYWDLNLCPARDTYGTMSGCCDAHQNCEKFSCKIQPKRSVLRC